MDGDGCRRRERVENARRIVGQFLVCNEEECCLRVKRRALCAEDARKLHSNPLEIAEAVDGLCKVVEAVLTGIHGGLIGRGRHCITVARLRADRGAPRVAP